MNDDDILRELENLVFVVHGTPQGNVSRVTNVSAQGAKRGSSTRQLSREQLKKHLSVVRPNSSNTRNTRAPRGKVSSVTKDERRQKSTISKQSVQSMLFSSKDAVHSSALLSTRSEQPQEHTDADKKTFESSAQERNITSDKTTFKSAAQEQNIAPDKKSLESASQAQEIASNIDHFSSDESFEMEHPKYGPLPKPVKIDVIKSNKGFFFKLIAKASKKRLSSKSETVATNEGQESKEKPPGNQQDRISPNPNDKNLSEAHVVHEVNVAEQTTAAYEKDQVSPKPNDQNMFEADVANKENNTKQEGPGNKKDQISLKVSDENMAAEAYRDKKEVETLQEAEEEDQGRGFLRNISHIASTKSVTRVPPEDKAESRFLQNTLSETSYKTVTTAPRTKNEADKKPDSKVSDDSQDQVQSNKSQNTIISLVAVKRSPSKIHPDKHEAVTKREANKGNKVKKPVKYPAQDGDQVKRGFFTNLLAQRGEKKKPSGKSEKDVSKTQPEDSKNAGKNFLSRAPKPTENISPDEQTTEPKSFDQGAGLNEPASFQLSTITSDNSNALQTSESKHGSRSGKKQRHQRHKEIPNVPIPSPRSSKIAVPLANQLTQTKQSRSNQSTQISDTSSSNLSSKISRSQIIRVPLEKQSPEGLRRASFPANYPREMAISLLEATPEEQAEVSDPISQPTSEKAVTEQVTADPAANSTAANDFVHEMPTNQPSTSRSKSRTTLEVDQTETKQLVEMLRHSQSSALPVLDPAIQTEESRQNAVKHKVLKRLVNAIVEAGKTLSDSDVLDEFTGTMIVPIPKTRNDSSVRKQSTIEFAQGDEVKVDSLNSKIPTNLPSPSEMPMSFKRDNDLKDEAFDVDGTKKRVSVIQTGEEVMSLDQQLQQKRTTDEGGSPKKKRTSFPEIEPLSLEHSAIHNIEPTRPENDVKYNNVELDDAIEGDYDTVSIDHQEDSKETVSAGLVTGSPISEPIPLGQGTIVLPDLMKKPVEPVRSEVPDSVVQPGTETISVGQQLISEPRASTGMAFTVPDAEPVPLQQVETEESSLSEDDLKKEAAGPDISVPVTALIPLEHTPKERDDLKKVAAGPDISVPVTALIPLEHTYTPKERDDLKKDAAGPDISVPVTAPISLEHSKERDDLQEDAAVPDISVPVTAPIPLEHSRPDISVPVTAPIFLEHSKERDDLQKDAAGPDIFVPVTALIPLEHNLKEQDDLKKDAAGPDISVPVTAPIPLEHVPTERDDLQKDTAGPDISVPVTALIPSGHISKEIGGYTEPIPLTTAIETETQPNTQEVVESKASPPKITVILPTPEETKKDPLHTNVSPPFSIPSSVFDPNQVKVELSFPTRSTTVMSNWLYYGEDLDTRPLPQWYDAAKVGIIVHWGLYSVPSFKTEWLWYHWKKGNKEVADFVSKKYRPSFTYQEFAPMFKGQFFDPNEWASLFQYSGAKYVILTAKHHDGFRLFPAKNAYNWNSVDVGPKRNIVKELSEAVTKRGMRFGVYYSLYEVYNPFFNEDKKNMFKTDNYVNQYVRPDLVHLVNEYKTSVIWADGDWIATDAYWRSEEFLAWLYNESPAQKSVVVNSRWGCKYSSHGDFFDADRRATATEDDLKNKHHKWEKLVSLDKQNCLCFRKDLKIGEFMTLEELLKELVATIAFGGNVLINVGVNEDGIITPLYEERLTELGTWLAVNGEAIYNSSPWFHQKDSANDSVWYTCRKAVYDPHSTGIQLDPTTVVSAVYAIFFKWPTDGLIQLTDIISFMEETPYNVHLLMGEYTMSLTANFIQNEVFVLLPDKDTVKTDIAWTLKFLPKNSPEADDNLGPLVLDISVIKRSKSSNRSFGRTGSKITTGESSRIIGK